MLSSSTALGLNARSLHQCCRAQCSHTTSRAPRGENMDPYLQVTLVHGSAVGTATPKHPKDQSVALLVEDWLGVVVISQL